MNINGLKELAESLEFHGRYGHETEDQASKRRVKRNASAAAAILELITQLEDAKQCGDGPACCFRASKIESLESQLEDAQGEIRARRATEAGLVERVKELEKGLRRATDALDSLTDKVDGTGFAESDEFNNALDEIDLGRALLEKKE